MSSLVGVPSAGVEHCTIRAHGPGVTVDVRHHVHGLALPDLERQLVIGTDLATVRQRVQRALAVQLQVPIDDLVDYLDGDNSTGAINEADGHFQISPWR